jgi:hypothetical protein
VEEQLAAFERAHSSLRSALDADPHEEQGAKPGEQRGEPGEPV